jgi:hypothetical protein
MIKRAVEINDLHVRGDGCEDCVDVYVASEADASIAELRTALQDCVFILLKQRESMNQWASTCDTAIEQARKALALMESVTK